MSRDFMLLILLLAAGACWGVATKKLLLSGGLVGVVLGGLVYGGAGFTGIALLGGFFVSGSLVTSWKHAEKSRFSPAQGEDGPRTPGQVLANGGVAGLLGLGGMLFPVHRETVTLLMAASLAAAASDTFSSELGSLYGRRFFNILTFKKEPRGLDGVVSGEGFLFGLVGSGLLAVLYSLGTGRWDFLVLIALCGLAGNLIDSLLGAALERRGILKNNAVNFLNTFSAALLAFALGD